MATPKKPPSGALEKRCISKATEAKVLRKRERDPTRAIRRRRKSVMKAAFPGRVLGRATQWKSSDFRKHTTRRRVKREDRGSPSQNYAKKKKN